MGCATKSMYIICSVNKKMKQSITFENINENSTISWDCESRFKYSPFKPEIKSQALPWEFFHPFFHPFKDCPLCYINCNQLEIKFKSSSNWYCCKNITYFRSEQLFHVPVFNSEMCGLEEQQINTYRFSIFRRIKTVKQHQMKMITSLLSNGPDE